MNLGEKSCLYQARRSGLEKGVRKVSNLQLFVTAIPYNLKFTNASVSMHILYIIDINGPDLLT